MPLSTLRVNQGNTLPRSPFAETHRLDQGAPVTIIDHPRQFRIVIDRRADAETIARGLTMALGETHRRGNWTRNTSGLWLTTG